MVFANGRGMKQVKPISLGGDDVDLDDDEPKYAVWDPHSQDAAALAQEARKTMHMMPRKIYDKPVNTARFGKYGFKTIQHELNKLRTALKKTFGHGGKDSKSSSAKRVKLNESGDFKDSDDDDDGDNCGRDENRWLPPYIASTYLEFRTKRKHFSATIGLPSGVATTVTDDVNVALEDNDSTLVISFKWPHFMQAGGLEELHKLMNDKESRKTTTYHNKLQASDEAADRLKRKCEESNHDGKIYSVFRLSIGFQVVPVFVKKRIVPNKEDGSRILYLDLEEVVPEKPKEEKLEFFDDVVDVSTPPDVVPSVDGNSK